MPSQRQHRQSIDVGPLMDQVSPVGYWIGCDFLSTPERVAAAIWLADHQHLDGMGKTRSEWLGIPDELLNTWRCDKTLLQLAEVLLSQANRKRDRRLYGRTTLSPSQPPTN